MNSYGCPDAGWKRLCVYSTAKMYGKMETCPLEYSRALHPLCREREKIFIKRDHKHLCFCAYLDSIKKPTTTKEDPTPAQEEATIEAFFLQEGLSVTPLEAWAEEACDGLLMCLHSPAALSPQYIQSLLDRCPLGGNL